MHIVQYTHFFSLSTFTWKSINWIHRINTHKHVSDWHAEMPQLGCTIVPFLGFDLKHFFENASHTQVQRKLPTLAGKANIFVTMTHRRFLSWHRSYSVACQLRSATLREVSRYYFHYSRVLKNKKKKSRSGIIDHSCDRVITLYFFFFCMWLTAAVW